MGNIVGLNFEEDEAEEPRAKSVWDLYEVGEKLGSGNFGEVRACRSRNGRDEDLAIKIVDRTSAAVKAAEAFQTARAEVDILRAVHHPYVIELREVFEDERYLYAVMERLAGGELFKAVSDRRAEILEDDMARVGLQLLQALQYLHSNCIVHRDVKAQNILLTEPPRVPGRALLTAAVKLIDFGLATRVTVDCIGANEGRLDLVCGTPAMCAPEIWASQHEAPKVWKRLWGTSYGPKVDVWAIGVVLYMAVHGRLPFHDKQASRLAVKVCNPHETPSFQGRCFGHRLSTGCRDFLSSVLEKDHRFRPTSAAACSNAWLQKHGRRRTRALAFIPQEVRDGVLEASEQALEPRMPVGGPSAEELCDQWYAARKEAAAERRCRAREMRERSSSSEDGSSTTRSSGSSSEESVFPAWHC